MGQYLNYQNYCLKMLFEHLPIHMSDIKRAIHTFFKYYSVLFFCCVLDLSCQFHDFFSNATNWLLQTGCYKLIATNWLLQTGCYKLVSTNWLLQNSCYKMVGIFGFVRKEDISSVTRFSR